ncbi:hypothetical protein DFH28DRAFT_892537 [Melampsora americana]|nr:hypothetical protein DFH28DRAFT_892537 [Melampsora americana]
MKGFLKLCCSFQFLTHLYILAAGDVGLLEAKVFDRRSLGLRIDLNTLPIDEEVDQDLEGVSRSYDTQTNLINLRGDRREDGQLEGMTPDSAFAQSDGHSAFKSYTRSMKTKNDHVKLGELASISGVQDNEILHGYPVAEYFSGKLGQGRSYTPYQSYFPLNGVLDNRRRPLSSTAAPTAKVRNQSEANKWADNLLKNAHHQTTKTCLPKNVILPSSFVQPTESSSNIGCSMRIPKSSSAFETYQKSDIPVEASQITPISHVSHPMDQGRQIKRKNIKIVASNKDQKTVDGRFSRISERNTEQDTELWPSTMQEMEATISQQRIDEKRGKSKRPLRSKKLGRPRRRKFLFVDHMPQGDQGLFDFQKESSYISSMTLIAPGREVRPMSGFLTSPKDLQLSNSQELNSHKQKLNGLPIESQLKWAYDQQQSNIKCLFQLIRAYSDWIGNGTQKEFKEKDIVGDRLMLQRYFARDPLWIPTLRELRGNLLSLET